MPLGQFTPGQTLVEALTVFDNFTTFNRGIKAGSGFGTPTVSVVAVAAGAGTGATVTSQRGSDFAGAFTITGGTGSTGGTVANLTFASQLPIVPTSVVVDITDNNGTAVSSGPNALATTGFAFVSGSLTLNHTYTCTYLVIQ